MTYHSGPSFGLQLGGGALLIAVLSTLVHYRARHSVDVSQTYFLGWLATSAASAAWGWLIFRLYANFSPGAISLVALTGAIASGATLKFGSRLVKAPTWERLDSANRAVSLLIAQAVAAAGLLLLFGALIGLATVRGSF